jgi:hypothetical protein
MVHPRNINLGTIYRWSASPSDRFNAGERAPSVYCIVSMVVLYGRCAEEEICVAPIGNRAPIPRQ